MSAAGNKALNFFSDHKKVIGLAIAIILLIIIILVFRKKIQKWIKEAKAKKQEEELVKNAENTININNLSYPITQYNSFADRLYEAMRGWGPYNTDEQAIYDVLQQLSTGDDYWKVVAVFGIRKDMNLVSWLQYELGNKAMEKVRQILNNIGVTI